MILSQFPIITVALLGHDSVPTEALAVLVVEPVVAGVLGADAVAVLALQVPQLRAARYPALGAAQPGERERLVAAVALALTMKNT